MIGWVVLAVFYIICGALSVAVLRRGLLGGHEANSMKLVHATIVFFLWWVFGIVAMNECDAMENSPKGDKS